MNSILMFDFEDESRSTTNPAFTLGAATGGYAPGTLSIGSVTGPLFTGHDYSLDVQAFTDSLSRNQGGIGTGGITLDVTPVPEARSAVVIPMISLMVAICRQRGQLPARCRDR